MQDMPVDVQKVAPGIGTGDHMGIPYLAKQAARHRFSPRLRIGPLWVPGDLLPPAAPVRSPLRSS